MSFLDFRFWTSIDRCEVLAINLNRREGNYVQTEMPVQGWIFLPINKKKDVEKNVKHSYLNRMSQNQILMGNIFLTTLIKYSFRQRDNIIHSGNIQGI